jgi:hypothetical protein
MDETDVIVSELIDLTGIPLSVLIDPPDDLRPVLDAAAERVVRELLQPRCDGC